MLQNDYISNIINKSKEYIEKCEERIIYHNNNSRNSKKWDSFLSVCNIVLTSSMALTMTLLSVYVVPETTVAIIGSIFSFLILVSNKIRDEYDFKLLGLQHDLSSDDYSELKQSIVLFLSEIDKHKLNDTDFNNLIIKYETIIQKSHHREVCKIFCFCIK